MKKKDEKTLKEESVDALTSTDSERSKHFVIIKLVFT